MPRMLKELSPQPDLGFLHAEMWFSRTIIVVQYWRSFNQAVGTPRPDLALRHTGRPRAPAAHQEKKHVQPHHGGFQ